MRRRRRSNRSGIGYGVAWLLVLALIAAVAIFGWVLMPTGTAPLSSFSETSALDESAVTGVIPPPAQW